MPSEFLFTSKFSSRLPAHCSAAAIMAHKFALENDLMRADIVDSSEFPQLAVKYGVMGVPKVVINERVEFVRAVSKGLFLQQVLLGAR